MRKNSNASRLGFRSGWFLRAGRVFMFSAGFCAFWIDGHSSCGLVSFGAGIFQIRRPNERIAEFEIEYQFSGIPRSRSFAFLELRPIIGAMTTTRESFYLYGGINFELSIGPKLILTPGFAAGGYWRGHGRNLGYPIEFRSSIEASYRCLDDRRLGVRFYHLSNASLARKNPGSESLVVFYSIPIKSRFPYIKDN